MTAGKKPAARLSVLPMRKSPVVRVGEKCEFLNTVLEFVKNCPPARDEGAAVSRRFDAAAATVEQAKPERVLHVRNRLRYCGLRNR
jgi:hypothetical protein